jgi:DNA polymerase-3 subunit alpha (Gram-positive type)
MIEKCIGNFVSLDIETTGLDPKSDKIIEIGAVKVRDMEIVDRFEIYVNPGRLLPEKITEITGISQKDIEGAPAIGQVISAVRDFVGDDILLGHSILFDYSFLKRACVNEKLTFEKKALDTLRIARAYLPELESRSLPYLCKHFQIPHQAHRALEDAIATFELYKILQNLFENRDEGILFQPIALNYQVKKEGPITKAQKERIIRLLAAHKITPDYQVEFLTKNEASRIIDQIFSIYGREFS